jgi:hypothetical protein
MRKRRRGGMSDPRESKQQRTQQGREKKRGEEEGRDASRMFERKRGKEIGVGEGGRGLEE